MERRNGKWSSIYTCNNNKVDTFLVALIIIGMNESNSVNLMLQNGIGTIIQSGNSCNSNDKVFSFH